MNLFALSNRAALIKLSLSALSLLALLSAMPSQANRILAKGEVKSLYQKNCASCHGDKLEGGMATSLLDDKWLTDGSDQALAKAIKHGIDGTAMPAMGGALTDEQIRTLVVLIRESRYLNNQSSAKTKQQDNSFNSKHHSFSLETVTETDEIIWAFDFLPSGELIFTERSGNLVLLANNKQTVISGTPKVWQRGQGGLLDVAVDPEYAKNGWIYLSYSKNSGKKGVGALTIARGKIIDGKWQQHQELYHPKVDMHINRGRHFGSRFAFEGDYLYFSYGDEGHQDLAQDLSKHGGKIHRIFKDGRVPKDNPFVSEQNAIASIWTYGNRNPQGMAIHPLSKQIWSSEHGPRGGDELNVISKGLNYGWPKVSYGMNYNGSPLTMHTEMAGMESPKHHWTPSIAVAGINFYTGELFPNWQNQLFVASLAMQQLHRINIKDAQVIEDEVILKGQGRIRDVATGPDGALYLSLNDKTNDSHKIVKLIPSN